MIDVSQFSDSYSQGERYADTIYANAIQPTQRAMFNFLQSYIFKLGWRELAIWYTTDPCENWLDGSLKIIQHFSQKQRHVTIYKFDRSNQLGSFEKQQNCENVFLTIDRVVLLQVVT